MTFPEGITYIALYFFTNRNFTRLLRRFYMFHIPYTLALEYIGTVLLFLLFLAIIRKYPSYWVRLTWLVGIAALSYWIT